MATRQRGSFVHTRLNLAAALIAVSVVIAACGGSSPASSNGPVGPGGPNPSESALPVGSGVPVANASIAGMTNPCSPEAPTSLSQNWKTMDAHDGDYSFKYPSDWEHHYGLHTFVATDLLDIQTIAETGLDPNATFEADLVRAPGTGLPNASVLIVPGVTSSNSVIYGREVTRFNQISGVQVLHANLTACIGGEQAHGMELLFNNGQTYQQSWFMVHAGRSYDFQWLADRSQPQTDTFVEMFRTWHWTPNFPVATPIPAASGTVQTVPPSPSASVTASSPSASPSESPTASPVPTASVENAFAVAGMAKSVSASAKAADPKSFVDTFATTATSIYAVFALNKGLTGRVTASLSQGNSILVTLSLDYTTSNTWGDFRINSTNGFAAGDYEMTLTYGPTGSTISLPFTVK